MIITTQSTCSTLTPPPPQSTEFTTDDFKDHGRHHIKHHTTRFFPNTRATRC